MDVLLIDDDPRVFEDLSVLLPTSIDLKGISGKGEVGKVDLVLGGGRMPDAIILDLCLPDRGGKVDVGEGLGLLDRLRNELAVGIPVVVLTSVPREEAECRCLELGASIYLEKPCVIADLVWILNAVVRG